VPSRHSSAIWPRKWHFKARPPRGGAYATTTMAITRSMARGRGHAALALASLPTELLLDVARRLDVRDRARLLCALPRHEAGLVRSALDAAHERTAAALYRYALTSAPRAAASAAADAALCAGSRKLVLYLSTHAWDATMGLVADRLGLAAAVHEERQAARRLGGEDDAAGDDCSAFLRLLWRCSAAGPLATASPAAGPPLLLVVGRRLTDALTRRRPADRGGEATAPGAPVEPPVLMPAARQQQLYDAILEAVPRLSPPAFDALVAGGVVAALLRRATDTTAGAMARIREEMLLWSMLNYDNVALFEHVVAPPLPGAAAYPWDLRQQALYLRTHADAIRSDSGTAAALRFVVASGGGGGGALAEGDDWGATDLLLERFMRTFAEGLRVAPLERLLALRRPHAPGGGSS
jgi:hypothetical protein